MRSAYLWRSRPGAILALLTAGILIAAMCGVAQAHANLARSNPPAGATLPAAPDHVQVWFTEDPEPSFSQVVVYDASRQRVDNNDSHVDRSDPSSMIVGLKPNLPEGSYAIAWRVQSRVDGHITSGIVPFSVGTSGSLASLSPPAVEPIGSVSGSPLEMMLRWLTLLSVVTLVGAFAFWVLQRSSAASQEGSASQGRVSIAQRWVAWIAWITFAASSVVFLIGQVSTASSVSLPGVLGEPLLRMLTATQYGHLWALRMVLGALLGVLLLLRQRARGRRAVERIDLLALTAGAGLLLGISLTSHSAAIGSLTPLGVVNDWLHLGAATVWIGGLLQLTVLLASPAAIGVNRSVSAQSPSLLVIRFAQAAMLALVVLVVTGVVGALLHVGSLDHLLGSGYGEALLVKLLLIVPLVAIAVVNHFLILPAFVRGRATTKASTHAHMRAVAGVLSWTVRLEVVFAVGVIAAVGVMASLSPPQQSGRSTSAGPLTLTAPVEDLTLTLALAPGRPGPNRYVVDLRDSKGQRVSDLERVSVRFAYLDNDLGVSEAVLTPVGPGQFEGESRDLAVAGRWQAEVLVRRAGRADVSGSFGFEVTPEGARTLQAEQLELGWLLYAGTALVLIGCVAAARGVSLRSYSRRRALVVVVSGLVLCVIGGQLVVGDIRRSRAQSSVQALAQRYPATARSIASGASVYRQNCLLCHGPDGRGDGLLARALVPPPSDLSAHVPLHDDVELFGWISNGKPGSSMPAFRNKLTEQQRWEVLSYVKSRVSAPPLITLAQNAGPTLVTLTIDPAQSGANQFLATLQDVDGTLVTDAQVRLRVQSLPATGEEDPPVDMVMAGSVHQSDVVLLPSGRWRLEVLVARAGQPESTASFDVTLPIPGTTDADRLLTQVDQTMNQLHSVVEDSELTAGGPMVTTRYAYVSPDRMHYAVQSSDRTAQTYVIGTKRYDRKGDGPWQAMPFPGTQPFRWPSYDFSRNATQVTIVDQEPVQNTECVVVSFLDSPSGTRHRLWVGTEDHRVYKHTMMAIGHYMTSVFSEFDAPLGIEPPIASQGD